MSSWLSDSAELVSGGWLSSQFAGLGVPASQIPSTGTSGPGYLFNDVAAQGAVPTDEMRGEILTWPSAGTLVVNEDSSFVYTGASDSFTYRGYIKGVAYGDYTVTLTVGAGSAAELQAVAMSVSTSTAVLATQIALAASAVSESTVTAVFDTSESPFASDAISVSTATADLQTFITLAANALSISSVTALLTSEMEAYEPHEVRMVFVDAGDRCRLLIRRFAHSPDAELDYSFNWGENKWLQPGEQIVASVWHSSSDLVFSRHQILNGEITSAFIVGGKEGYKYRVTNTVVTNQGRKDSRTLNIDCKYR